MCSPQLERKKKPPVCQVRLMVVVSSNDLLAFPIAMRSALSKASMNSSRISLYSNEMFAC